MIYIFLIFNVSTKVRTGEAFEVPRLMQMFEEYEEVLQKNDFEDELIDQIIAEFEESRITLNDSYDSVTKRNSLNAREE